MARLTKVETDKRRQEAKRLYINGADMADIAKASGVGRDTVARWAAEGEWSESRDAKALGIEEVNNLIYKAILEIKEGKTPKISPDQISKLVTAFEKLNDKQKSMRYGMLAYNMLTDKILVDINEEKSKQKREQYFDVFSRVRTLMDEIIDNWFKQINA